MILFNVKETAVLVTGASTCIGEATAYHLGGRGFRVFAGVRKQEDAARLESRSAGRITPLILDVTQQEDIEQSTKAIDAAVGEAGLAGLVNNAGIGLGGPLEYLPLEAWRRLFDVNVFGQVEVTRQMLPLIRKATGRIVFVGSIGGRAPGLTALLSPYNASKFALEAIADSLRVELNPDGIRVSLIEPGAVKTAIWDKGQRAVDEFERNLPAQGRERYGRVVQRARKLIEMQDRRGISPVIVARAIEDALTNSSRAPPISSGWTRECKRL